MHRILVRYKFLSFFQVEVVLRLTRATSDGSWIGESTSIGSTRSWRFLHWNRWRVSGKMPSNSSLNRRTPAVLETMM